jgi:hypothetical protein
MKAGHRFSTPTPTGLGERSHLIHPNINLITLVADVVNVLKWERLTDVVLYGHSNGDFVISAPAEQMPHEIVSIVFIDALVPEDGATVAEVAFPATREQLMLS